MPSSRVGDEAGFGFEFDFRRLCFYLAGFSFSLGFVPFLAAGFGFGLGITSFLTSKIGFGFAPSNFHSKQQESNLAKYLHCGKYFA